MNQCFGYCRIRGLKWAQPGCKWCCYWLSCHGRQHGPAVLCIAYNIRLRVAGHAVSVIYQSGQLVLILAHGQVVKPVLFKVNFHGASLVIEWITHPEANDIWSMSKKHTLLHC